MTPKQEHINALQSIPWFQDLDQEHFENMVAISEIIEVEAGKAFLNQGDNQDYLYIVITGRVGLEIAVPGKGRTRISTIEPTELLGWSSITPVIRQRTASAVAVLPSVMIRLKGSELRKLCEDDHSFGYLIMHKIANVAASRLLLTRLQLLDMFSYASKEENNA